MVIIEFKFGSIKVLVRLKGYDLNTYPVLVWMSRAQKEASGKVSETMRQERSLGQLLYWLHVHLQRLVLQT